MIVEKYLKYEYFIAKIFIIYLLLHCNYIKINKFKNLENIFIKYINDCNTLKRYNNKTKVKNHFPFISICISVYNSEKYIEKAILSIINQSFQNFEIIVVNDFSIDNTLYVLTKLQKEDNRIKIINHLKNEGTYHCRVEGALYSKGKYILYLDPDDMILNPNLFKILFKFSFNYFDIIEYTVCHYIENNNKFFCPKEHELNHYHNYSKNIIYQPELSNILYFKPRTEEYSSVICRTVWNKLYKKEVILKTINYIGNDYFQNKYIIVVEDTLLNIIIFNFAKNYTNINIDGYLYNIRESSISRLESKELLIKTSISFFLYYQLFYRLIKEYDKDRNFLFYDFNIYGNNLLNLKKYKIKYYLKKAKNLLNEIINDDKSSLEFKNYIKLNYYNLLK